MSKGARKRDVLAWAMAVLGLALLLRLVFFGPIGGPSGVGTGSGTGGAAPRDSSAAFTISGTAVDPISPGVMAPLDLALTNPHDVAMVVTDLSVTVREVSAPDAAGAGPCGIGDFAVEQVPSGLVITVAARSTSTLSDLGLARATWPQVGMLDRPVNQDGCKGAALTVGYAASGTLAR